MILTGKQKYADKILSHCHFVYQISYMDCPGIEAGSLR
jgi:hypothetical protein